MRSVQFPSTEAPRNAADKISNGTHDILHLVILKQKPTSSNLTFGIKIEFTNCVYVGDCMFIF